MFRGAGLAVMVGMLAAPLPVFAEIVDPVRVSVASDGTQANNRSYYPAISGDGSMVVYRSFASNLVVGDTNGAADVFMFDVASGTTTRVSVASDGTQANNNSYSFALSGDGSMIAYSSSASNLVVGDTNGAADVFMFDVASHTTTRVSVASDGTQANGNSFSTPAISGDRSTVAYQSDASNLVVGDTNGVADVFMFDVASGTTTRVSVASDGTQANNSSFHPALSGDGSIIAYASFASNLVVGDTNGTDDVFVLEMASQTTTSVTCAGDGNRANGGSSFPDLSADGSTVAYLSAASNLVAGDTNNTQDAFITRKNLWSRCVNRFIDDDGSVFENDIEWMAARSITQGCNPPTNDRFCPDDYLTRAQMAAFLVRALGLTDRLDDPFVDDDESIFEADIERLAAAGITKGCNPPTNDRFCPDNKVTREVMAAFLVRALGYTDDGGGDLFTDDDDSIFEGDIDRLGTAGVTKGCNPSEGNTRFCPTGYVTRGQMAAFLHRALS